MDDDLGKYIRAASALLEQEGWEKMCEHTRGRTHIAPNVGHLPHPAAPLLSRLRKRGAPVVTTTPPWTVD